MAYPVSPLAPSSFPDPAPIDGVRLAVGAAGVRYAGRNDVLMMRFDEGTAVAGVFTKSKCPSAPVEWCKEHLSGGQALGLVVNSGNANAFTGAKGREGAKLTAEAAGAALNCAPGQIFLASTGTIGEPLPAQKITAILGELAKKASDTGWLDAAKAIMTTDTFPKVATRMAKIGGVAVRLNGIAKGSGMIAPDMATMLSYVATDAALSPACAQALLSDLVGASFNSITVDSDTSTSDSLMLFATGAAAKKGAPLIGDPADPRLAEFKAALADLLLELALLVVKDGEGASKFIAVHVTGAVDDASAKRVGLSIANSPLVKTAIAGEDANWGRIVMAVGKAGEPAERDCLTIWFGDLKLAEAGERSPSYNEEAATSYMRRQDIDIKVDLALGQGKATVYTCDFTDGYIRINGAYRT
ncbi:MAG: bifunctional glutamate N-acetyltransferase/amino-acid acetyltransferase ArgJ [Caulobacterales bacterium]